MLKRLQRKPSPQNKIAIKIQQYVNSGLWKNPSEDELPDVLCNILDPSIKYNVDNAVQSILQAKILRISDLDKQKMDVAGDREGSYVLVSPENIIEDAINDLPEIKRLREDQKKMVQSNLKKSIQQQIELQLEKEEKDYDELVKQKQQQLEIAREKLEKDTEKREKELEQSKQNYKK